MIPFALAPFGAFVKRIPRGVWIAVAVVAILLLGTCAHKKAVKKAYDEAFKAGVTHEGARIAEKAQKLASKAEQIAFKLKEQNNETNRRITGDADALRVSGPGKASCLNPATPSPRQRQPASGNANAAGSQVPSGNGPALQEIAAVPWPWLVNRAEICDLNRAEVLTWRSWHKQLTEEWEKSR